MEKHQINFNEIPAELRSLGQWVLWKYEMINGRKTKIPYQADGTKAQANSRRTWASFPVAAKFYLKDNYDGIGFVFSRMDNYIGIDIDHCVEDGEINDFAKEIIDTFDSYTEFSPSGNGIHIIIRGNLPQGVTGTGRKSTKHGLEIYQYGRFFTMTGNAENSNDIYERTDELAEVFEKYFDDSDIKNRVSLEEYEKDEIAFSNDELWEKMFRSKNGDEIRALYNGELLSGDHSSDDLALCNHLAFWTAKSAPRMDSMFRETGLMRDKWDIIHYTETGETYGERTIGMAIASTPSTILDNIKEYEEFNFTISCETVEDAAIEKPIEKKIEEAKNFRLSELGNAERVAYEYGHVMRFINGIGWYIWNGKRWCFDDKSEVERIIAKVLRGLHHSEDEDARKWAKQCERRNIRNNTKRDLEALLPGSMSDFDTHDFLLNVENGVIDLKTGELKPHDRNLFITKYSNVTFDSEARCPEWLKFLDSIFLGNTELIEYMQRVIGYALTSNISEQAMFFLVGGGANGKSTFINTVKELFGEYGKQTNSDTFIKKKESGANNDIARLAGARFVSAIESEEGERLSESLVKQITGGEPILARFLRQEFFEFTPGFKVFFTTNHKPIIGGLDAGIWRRVKLVPFKLNLPPEKRDKRLNEKLLLELPGILNWAVEGCLKWQKDGLKEPKVVAVATNKYKDEMDLLAPFINERCYVDQKDNSIKIEAKELYNEYERFTYQSGDTGVKNSRAFYRMLETKGFEKRNGAKNKNYFYGITLIEKAPDIGLKTTAEKVNENEEKVPFFKVL